MNVILLGAGRGARLMPYTASQPKCFTEVAGARILDWTLRAFRQNDLDRFVFVGGYLMDVVRDAYPNFSYVENPAWATTNILASSSVLVNTWPAASMRHTPIRCTAAAP